MSTWNQIKQRIDPLNLQKGIYESDNKYAIPTIHKDHLTVKHLLPFGNKKYHGTAHFFLDDFKFERVWNTPKKYIETLRQYQGVLSPDFSLYTDYPIAVQIWNVYRNRWLGRYWQEQGIQVIPTVGWSTPESYDFCFEGIEHGSTVAISTLGILRNKEAIKLFISGFNEMNQRIEPEEIILYGRLPTSLMGCISQPVNNIKIYEDFMTRRKQKWAEEDQKVE